MSDLQQWLYGQGVLGVVVMVLLWAVRHLYLETQKLRDRYEIQREKSNEKLESLAASVNRVLESIGKRQ